MSHKILKSLLPTEEHVNSFQRLINAQIEEMRMHDLQMANVEKDPENFHSYPAPVSHPDIMNSIVKVGKDYNIEFEIIDDAPKLSLEEKKSALSSNLNVEFLKLQEIIFPSRKRNLAAIENGKLAAIEEDKRTPSQKKSLEEYQEKMTTLGELIHHHAKMEAAIEDLTEKNIDTWKHEPFPEIK